MLFLLMFADDGDEDYWERFFKILPLPDMFLRLKNKCQAVQDPNVIAFPNAVLPKLELLKDTYHYDATTACKVKSSSSNVNYYYSIKIPTSPLLETFNYFFDYVPLKTLVKNGKMNRKYVLTFSWAVAKK